VKFKTARKVFCLALLTSASAGVAHAQDATPAVDEYVAVLSQIENVKLNTAQREIMASEQEAIMGRLKAQIEQVPETKSAVRGIVTEMVAEIEKVIVSDLPFKKEERFARLERLRALLADANTLDSDLFRRAMTLYDIEANYGYTISAYTGDHPTSPGRRITACRENIESPVCNLSKDQKGKLAAGVSLDKISDTIRDGNYVHFGRLSFIYLDLDSREGLRWSKDANGWEPLGASDILNARKSVRIARGESAPGVVTAPIKVQAAQ